MQHYTCTCSANKVLVVERRVALHQHYILEVVGFAVDFGAVDYTLHTARPELFCARSAKLAPALHYNGQIINQANGALLGQCDPLQQRYRHEHYPVEDPVASRTLIARILRSLLRRTERR